MLFFIKKINQIFFIKIKQVMWNSIFFNIFHKINKIKSLSTSFLSMSSFQYNIKLVAFDSIFFNVIFYLKNQSDYYFIKIKQIMWNWIFNMIFFTKIKTCHLRLNFFKCYFYINITSSEYRLHFYRCQVLNIL